MRSVLWGLYQVVWGGLLLAVGPFLLARRGRHYLQSVRGRLGSGTAAPSLPGALWLHAVSVGEVGVAATLVRALPADLPVLITTVTPTGQARAEALFRGRGTVDYLPFDLGFSVRAFFRRHAPAGLVLVEGDYWPLVLRAARRRGMPIAVVNGRVGDRSFRRMRFLRSFLAPLFAGIGPFGLQTEGDRERLLELGIADEHLKVTGNLKFETEPPPELPELARTIETLAAGRPVLVAGSTMEGEEEAVLTALERAGGGERALLILAPRHPERWDAVASILEARGLAFVRRSGDLKAALRPAVFLLDTLGELASAYRGAAGAFVGGTLVPKGGHNPLEPARLGVPVAVGPSMENFREIASAFDLGSAWGRVGSGEELGTLWRTWLDRPEASLELGERARRLVLANRGATERTLALLEPLLAAVRRSVVPRKPGTPGMPGTAA